MGQDLFEQALSIEGLYNAWCRFRVGKRERPDVLRFETRLEDELFALRDDLASGNYCHQAYETFYVRDPKFRVIHKATIRDRIVHRAIYDALYPVFDNGFIHDSYAARKGRGLHAAIRRMETFIRRAGPKGPVWVMHADVDDYFASMDHAVLRGLIRRRVTDERMACLCDHVLGSFASRTGKGLPLGNLTSQLFSNVYLHELDRFMKCEIKARAYLRYNDDFFAVDGDRGRLEGIARQAQAFLKGQLGLSLPVEKILIRRLDQGVDVLGAVFFPWGMAPRRRVTRRASERVRDCRSAVSYLGLLRQTRSFLLRERICFASPYA